MTWRMACRQAAVGLFLLNLVAHSGAAETPSSWRCAPAASACRSVFIVHNSWHAAIVLRSEDLTATLLPELADFPDSHFVEFSWGDQDYFPDPNAGVWAALRAAFWSRGSVLHLVGFRAEIGSFYRGAEIIELRVSAPAYGRLIEYLSQSFARLRASERAPARPGLFAHSRFYPSTEKFSLMKTCNTWVATALQYAGLPVAPGLILTAAQLMEQIEKIRPVP